MFYNLCDLEKLARHIHTHQPHGRELAFALGSIASKNITYDAHNNAIQLVLESLAHLYEIGEERYAFTLEGAMDATLEGVKVFEQFIANLPEE